MLSARLLVVGWRAFAGRPSLWLASIVGFGFASATLLVVVAIGTGLERTLAASVRSDRAVVMRPGRLPSPAAAYCGNRWMSASATTA